MIASFVWRVAGFSNLMQHKGVMFAGRIVVGFSPPRNLLSIEEGIYEAGTMFSFMALLVDLDAGCRACPMRVLPANALVVPIMTPVQAVLSHLSQGMK